MLPLRLQIRAIRIAFMYLALIVRLLNGNMTDASSKTADELGNLWASWSKEAEAFSRAIR